jgi:hypothetical protein
MPAFIGTFAIAIVFDLSDFGFCVVLGIGLIGGFCIAAIAAIVDFAALHIKQQADIKQLLASGQMF